MLRSAGWLRSKCRELGQLYNMPSPEAVVKLSGDYDSEDKERIMTGFLNGFVLICAFLFNSLYCRMYQILTATDCCGMGVHVPGLRLVINIGKSH